MLRYKLRTLLILLAVLPPMGAVVAPPLLQLFAAKPVSKPIPPATPATQFVIYATGKADPSSMYKALTTLYAGAPNVRMALDSTTSGIGVLAPPYIHAELQRIIPMLQDGSPDDLQTIHVRSLSEPSPPRP